MSKYIAKPKARHDHITPKWRQHINRQKAIKGLAKYPHYCQTQGTKYPMPGDIRMFMKGDFLRCPLPVTNHTIWMFKLQGDYIRFKQLCRGDVTVPAIE